MRTYIELLAAVALGYTIAFSTTALRKLIFQLKAWNRMVRINDHHL